MILGPTSDEQALERMYGGQVDKARGVGSTGLSAMAVRLLIVGDGPLYRVGGVRQLGPPYGVEEVSSDLPRDEDCGLVLCECNRR